MRNQSTPCTLQEQFAQELLPRFELWAWRYFRRAGKRGEALAESVQEWRCQLWATFIRDENSRGFPSKLALFTAQHVLDGRKLCSPKNTSLESKSHWKAARVANLSALKGAQGFSNPDTLPALDIEDFRAQPDELAQADLDFGDWLQVRSGRDRKLVKALLADRANGAGSVIALRFGVSPGRMSQLRRALREDYERFNP